MVAVHLRAMNMLRGRNEKASVIGVPGTAVDGMNLGDLGGLGAAAEKIGSTGQAAGA